MRLPPGDIAIGVAVVVVVVGVVVLGIMLLFGDSLVADGLGHRRRMARKVEARVRHRSGPGGERSVLEITNGGSQPIHNVRALPAGAGGRSGIVGPPEAVLPGSTVVVDLPSPGWRLETLWFTDVVGFHWQRKSDESLVQVEAPAPSTTRAEEI